MRELARLPGFLLAELLGRLVASALVALLGWASDQLMHHVRYASPAVDMAGDLWGLDGHPEVVCLSHG